MPAMIEIDRIFRESRASPPSERTLPWEETCDGITVVVEPKPHWAEDMRVFHLEKREYCRYTDWAANGGHARFYGHIDTSGDDVMMRARTMIAREIADGLWDRALRRVENLQGVSWGLSARWVWQSRPDRRHFFPELRTIRA